ncbi:hypothetical protein F5887DRAFT_1250000 [Amanita rubescens]|nr:hypothetical protein F5887DRAFT_1250000 [Amanita rubescens]
MLFNANLLALAALFATGVHAWKTASSTSTAVIPTSTSQIPPCVLTCVEAALQSTHGACTSITSPCVCTNTEFQKSVATCLAYKCTASDAAAAAQLEKAVCTSTSASGSATATSTTTDSYSSTPSSSTSGGGGGGGGGGGSGGGGTSYSTTSSATSSSTSSSASSTPTKSAGVKITFDHDNLFVLAVGVVGAVFGGLMV